MPRNPEQPKSERKSEQIKNPLRKALNVLLDKSAKERNTNSNVSSAELPPVDDIDPEFLEDLKKMNPPKSLLMQVQKLQELSDRRHKQ